MAPDPLERLDLYIREARVKFESTLGLLVEAPTVSADPGHKDHIRAGAKLAQQVLESFGTKTEIVETPGNPVIVGRLASGTTAKTVTIYNHMDVQPAQEPEWTADPFRFRSTDGVYYGRGTTDDKGPALTALFAARYAQDQGVPLNIQFIWELEEEIGSPNFESFLIAHAARLKTDSVLVSDTIWISRQVPGIPYGLRGLQGATLHLETAERDAHSGIAGGVARNPLGELAAVLAKCYDAATGRILIPGFYDAVDRIGDEEMRSFLDSGFTVAEFKRGHGLRRLRTEDAREIVHLIWCSPTFEVHGIGGGYTGPGIKTVVPAKAEAKVSMRLVPHQDPATALDLLTKHVQSINPDVEVRPAGSLRPYLADFRGKHVEAARQAMLYGFGKRPALTREGGSIGAVVTMKELLKVPIVFMGLSLPEHGYHAPNEHFDWGQASGGMKAMVKYMTSLVAM